MPDRLKRSRLLLRLDSEIAASGTVVHADCKRAERAAHLAQLARFAEAKAEIAELQKRHDAAPQIETGIWIHFARGVLAYYENVGVCRTDHVRRAHAIAVASGHVPLRALCAGWLAMWDLSRLDMASLARHLREALTLAEPHHHAVRARCGLVAAQALHTAGRADLARRWYQSARHHATLDGDDAALNALMHNMAWARLVLLRQAVLTGGAADGLAPDVTISLQSFDQYDDILGGALWQDFRPLLRAQVLSLQGDPAGALALYESHAARGHRAEGQDAEGWGAKRHGAKGQGTERHAESSLLPRLRSTLLADKAWCLSAIGRAAQARSCAGIAVQSLDHETQIDDRAATHSRLAQVHAALGDMALARRHDAMARQAWREHALVQAKTVELLAGIDPDMNSAQKSVMLSLRR